MIPRELRLGCADAWSQCHEWDWTDESHHLRHTRKAPKQKAKRINAKAMRQHKKPIEDKRESWHAIDVNHGRSAMVCGTKGLVQLQTR